MRTVLHSVYTITNLKDSIADAFAVSAGSAAPWRDQCRQLSLVYIFRYLLAHGLAWHDLFSGRREMLRHAYRT